MKKLKIGLIACLACLALACCVALAACQPEAKTKYTVTWQKPDHIALAVEGYDNPPTELEEGTEVVFTLTPQTGYEVASVTPASIKKDGGKYKFTVERDITVNIKENKAIESVTATLKDANKIYYAGDTIEAEDITVTVKYKTAEDNTETLTSGYNIKYGTGDGEAFAIGDKSFTITYRGVSADPVTLKLLEGENGAVALVTIDPGDEGVITQAYRDAISGNASLSHVNYDNGVLTFTHKGLTDAVALPVLGTEVTKGQEGDYILRGWNGSETLTAVPKNTVVSVVYNLTASPQLLIINKIYYKTEEVEEAVTPAEGENTPATQAETQTVTVPYLVVEGRFKLATSAYLYLYEGNDKVELVGDTIKNTDPENRDFQLKFDMRKLVETGYKGKWMDIKFVTVVKEATDTEEAEKLTQEIMLEDYTNITDFCDTAQMINVGEYDYGFKVYSTGGHNFLKAVYEDAAVYSFTVEAGTVTEGEGATAVTLPALVIKGQIAAAQLSKYAGKAVKIDFNNGAWTVPIDANGAWTLTVPLRVEGEKSIAYGSNGYAHFSIIDPANNDDQLYKDGNDGNFLNKCCAGGLSDVEDRSSLGDVLTGNAIRIANADNTQVFYIGEGKWGGFVATSRNESVMIISTTGAKLEAGKITVTKADPDGEEGATIEVEEDGAYLVFTGTWKYFIDHTYNETADLETLKALFTEYSLQTDAGWGYLNGCSDNQKKAPNTVFVIHENGTFEVKIALNGASDDSYWYLHYCHAGRGNGDLNRSHLKEIDETTVTVGGQTFSIWDSTDAQPEGHQSWLKGRLIVYVAAAETSAE